MNTLSSLSAYISTTINNHFNLNDANYVKFDSNLNIDSSKQQFGDLSLNAAMPLAKKLGRSPRAIAEEIVNLLQHPSIARVEIAGPGFINIFFTPETFVQLAQEIATHQNNFFITQPAEPTTYNIEFVSANPTGPLHIGHGRGGIVGDVLARILKFQGNYVTSEFYINDAGNQIEKLGISFQIRCLQLLGQDVNLPEDGYHGEYLKILAQQCVTEYGAKLFQQPLSFFAEYAKKHLLAVLQNTLSAYNISYDVWFSEKSLHQSGAIEQLITLLKKRGYIYEQDGATWFKSTEFGDDKDRVVKKQSGELTYVAADIAYLQDKLDRGANKLIMILGQDHHSYVVRLKGIMQALGHNPDDLTVILYQLVTLKESGELMRLSKRAGRIISLEDVINIIGSDVTRFFYLNRKVDAHLDFDIDLALKKTDENPVYYLQYAYVRISSILHKAQTNLNKTAGDFVITTALNADEQFLVKKVVQLQEVLAIIARNHQTHQLAYYALELAQTFHSYYAAHKIILAEDPATTNTRLALVLNVRSTLKLCLDLMGLTAPETM